MATAKEPKPVKEKVKVSVAGIRQDLKDGIDRAGIAKKYDLTKADVKRIFEHKDLKGLKVRPTPGFEFIEDGTSVDTTTTASTSNTGGTTNPNLTAVKDETPAPAGEKKGVW